MTEKYNLSPSCIELIQQEPFTSKAHCCYKQQHVWHVLCSKSQTCDRLELVASILWGHKEYLLISVMEDATKFWAGNQGTSFVGSRHLLWMLQASLRYKLVLVNKFNALEHCII